MTSLADKVQSFFAQNVVTETHDVLKNLVFEVNTLTESVLLLLVLEIRNRLKLWLVFEGASKLIIDVEDSNTDPYE